MSSPGGVTSTLNFLTHHSARLLFGEVSAKKIWDNYFQRGHPHLDPCAGPYYDLMPDFFNRRRQVITRKSPRKGLNIKNHKKPHVNWWFSQPFQLKNGVSDYWVILVRLLGQSVRQLEIMKKFDVYQSFRNINKSWAPRVGAKYSLRPKEEVDMNIMTFPSFSSLK